MKYFGLINKVIMLICNRDIKDFKIYLDNNASICENYAATELQRYICKSYNTSLSIITHIDNPPNYLIIIGKTKFNVKNKILQN